MFLPQLDPWIRGKRGADMGCGSEVCPLNQYCDEVSNVCSKCSLICSGGHDARCQDHCSGYLSSRPPTPSISSTVGGSAEPVFGPKATPQCEGCSCVALYLVLALALLLLVIVILLVVKHYRKDIKGIFNQCTGRFLTRNGSNSSRGDEEAQPLIEHRTELVTCWRELTKLLDNKDQSQTEDKAVDCTWAHLAVDFKRWAGLFGKQGDRVLYTRQTETGEDMPGGSSEQPQPAAEYTGERSRHPTAISEPRDKNVKPSSDKSADLSKIPSAQQPSESPRSPAHGTVEHSGKKGVAVEVTNEEAAAPYKAEGNDPKNKTLQTNLTPARGTRHTSQGEATQSESSTKPEPTKGQPPKVPSTGGPVPGNNVYEHGRTAAEGPSHPAQASAKIPHRTSASNNTVSGTKEGQPPSSPTKVPHSSKSRQQESGAPRLEGYQPQSTHNPKTTSAARPETQGAQPNASSPRVSAAQTSTTSASQAPDPQATGPVQYTNGGNADRAANNDRAEENEEGDLSLRSDNSGGAAASAPIGAGAPVPEEGLTLSLDLRSDGHQTSSMASSAASSPFDHAISRLRERSKSIPGVRFRAVTMFKNYLELYVAIDDRSRNIQTVKRKALEIAGLGSSKLLVIEGTPPPIDPVGCGTKCHDVTSGTPVLGVGGTRTTVGGFLQHERSVYALTTAHVTTELGDVCTIGKPGETGIRAECLARLHHHASPNSIEWNSSYVYHDVCLLRVIEADHARLCNAFPRFVRIGDTQQTRLVELRLFKKPLGNRHLERPIYRLGVRGQIAEGIIHSLLFDFSSRSESPSAQSTVSMIKLRSTQGQAMAEPGSCGSLLAFRQVKEGASGRHYVEVFGMVFGKTSPSKHNPDDQAVDKSKPGSECVALPVWQELKELCQTSDASLRAENLQFYTNDHNKEYVSVTSDSGVYTDTKRSKLG